MANRPMVILINGSINAGKTTVSKALCRLLPRTAHIEVDDLRNFIGWMSLEESIPLNLKNAALAGRTFLDYGLNIVLSYPLSRDDYDYLVAQFQPYPCHAFTLRLPLEVAQSNRGARELSDSERQRIAVQYANHIAYYEFGQVLDNAVMSPEETARAILNHLGDIKGR